MENKISNIIKDYKDMFLIENNRYGAIYRGIDSSSKRDVCIKIYCKELLEKGKADYLLKQIEREVELNKLCKSENILELYESIDTPEAIILKYEPYEMNLMDYLNKNGDFKSHNINFFKKIVQEIAKALQVLHKNGVIHRDIKPNNIFLIKNKLSSFRFDIKLGNFNSSILVKENDYKQIGTILYTPPEIFKNIN